MHSFRRFLLAFAIVGGGILVPTAGHAQGRLVVWQDEWFTANDIFNNTWSSDDYESGRQFSRNVLDWLGLTPGKNVLVNSGTNLTLAPAFLDFLSNTRGLGVTIWKAPPLVDGSSYVAPNYWDFDAVITSAVADAQTQDISDYIVSGGKMLFIGGTTGNDGQYYGLTPFGFDFGEINNSYGFTPTTSMASQGPFGGALFTGVNQIFTAGPTPIVPFEVPEFYASQVYAQIFHDDNGNFVAGAMQFGGEVESAAPEPATLLLLATGILAIGVVLRRRAIPHSV